MSAIPKSVQYQAGGLPVTVSSRRSTVRLTPVNSGTYTPEDGGVIRFEFPRTLGWLDTSQSFFSFNFRFTDGNASKTTFTPDSHDTLLDRDAASWIDRIAIYSPSGELLEDLQDYGLLVNLMHKANAPKDYTEHMGKIVNGYQKDEASRMALAANSEGGQSGSQQYCIGLEASGILGSQSKYLPIKYISGSLMCEITLAPYAKCCRGKAVNRSYAIDQCEYICDSIQFEDAFDAAALQQVSTQGIQIHFDSFTRHTVSLTRSTGQQSHLLAQNVKSLKSAYMVVRKDEDISSREEDSLSKYTSYNIQSLQWDLGGKLYPSAPLPCKQGGAKVATESLKAWNRFRDVSGGSQVERDQWRFAQEDAYVTRRNPCIAVFPSNTAAAAATSALSRHTNTYPIMSQVFADASMQGTYTDAQVTNAAGAKLLAVETLNAAGQVPPTHTRLRFRYPHGAQIGEHVYLSGFQSNTDDKIPTGAAANAAMNTATGVLVVAVLDEYAIDVAVDTSTAKTTFWTTLTAAELVTIAAAKDSGDAVPKEAHNFEGKFAYGWMDTKHSQLNYRGEVRSSSDVKYKRGAIKDYNGDPLGDEDAMFSYNFETHSTENQTQISGLDTSGAVPLHFTVDVKAAPAKTCTATCFLHHDCLLRIGGSSADGSPLGGVVSASR